MDAGPVAVVADEIRNDVMHLNPDPPPVGTIDKLRKLSVVLRAQDAATARPDVVP